MEKLHDIKYYPNLDSIYITEVGYKAGDWCIDPICDNRLIYIESVPNFTHESKLEAMWAKFRRVIATNNEKIIKSHKVYGIPSNYVNYYKNEYDNGNEIDTVSLEYVCKYCTELANNEYNHKLGCERGDDEDYLKLNVIDGLVVIKKIDSFTKLAEIRDNLQENLEDYTLKTNEELIDTITQFGLGETEFHTADVERLIKENEFMRKQIEGNSIKSYIKKVSMSRYDKMNNELPPLFKINTIGDGKYGIIQHIVDETIEQTLSIQRTGKPKKNLSSPKTPKIIYESLFDKIKSEDSFKCFEVHRPNIPDNGCKNQCNECRDIENKE